jgi:hypothetical protein
MVRRRAQRAVSNHGGGVRLAAILRDALALLGLLRMRSEWRKVHSRGSGDPAFESYERLAPGFPLARERTEIGSMAVQI